MSRSQDERARSSPSVLVGTLAVKKPLFLNVRCEGLLGTLLGKKPCVINKQVDSERSSHFVCLQWLGSVSPALMALRVHNGFSRTVSPGGRAAAQKRTSAPF